MVSIMFMPHLAYSYSYNFPNGIPSPYRSLTLSTTLSNLGIESRSDVSAYGMSPQGKVAELRLELNSSGGKKDKNYGTKKIALKKIVANMTMSNNDMVALFPDIVGCMGIASLEIKKMCVYELLV